MCTKTTCILLVLGIYCIPIGSEKVLAQESGSKADVSSMTGTVPNEAARIIARGIEVYREQLCGICHRFEKAETKGVFGPAHDGFGVIAAKRVVDEGYTGEAQTAAEYVQESILNPKAYVVPGYGAGFHHMPPYVDLPPEDLNALVQLLLLEE